MAPEYTPTSTNGPALTPLITGIVNDAQVLIRQQLTLFQTELKNDLRRTKEASLPIAVGGVVLFLAGFFVCLSLAHVLLYYWPTMPHFCAYGTVGLLVGLVGAVLVYRGKTQFDAFNPLPEKSVEGLKENIQWKTKT
jgi:hypothetical protein